MARDKKEETKSPADLQAVHPLSGRTQPYGLPRKEGIQIIDAQVWEVIRQFIKSRQWEGELVVPEDKVDPLLATKPSYGGFMLGFDFHLTSQGPKLIEINTNAGGLATVFTFERNPLLSSFLKKKFVAALLKEYRLATGVESAVPSCVAIIDDCVSQQPLYPEMLLYKQMLEEVGICCHVVSPEDLHLSESSDALLFQGTPVDFVYNRLTDFRLKNPEHAHLREALLSQVVVMSPHPATYARCADKRQLLRLSQVTPLVPTTYQLKDKPIEDWVKIKKDYVFKPPDGAASRGVYRGNKISNTKLHQLPPDTIVQQFAAPFVGQDGAKQDFRVYTRDTSILGIATRHFTGQVLEMKSPKSGFAAVLPDGFCCQPVVVSSRFLKFCATMKQQCKEVPTKAATECHSSDDCYHAP